MRRYVRGGYTPLSLTLVLTAASGARAALPPQKAASVGRCSVEQVHGLFPEPAQVRPELRVLVASLSGADENALVLGQSVGRRLRAVLESHVRDEIKSDQTGLYADAIRVKFVPCTLDDHEHARAIGESGQADVVLWGEVLGLYASRAGRHGLAAEFFERAKKDVAATVAGAADLYRLIGTSYLIAGRKEAGLASLEAALRSCVRTEPRCEATGLHNLGWAKDRLGDKKAALSYYERALPSSRRGAMSRARRVRSTTSAGSTTRSGTRRRRCRITSARCR